MNSEIILSGLKLCQSNPQQFNLKVAVLSILKPFILSSPNSHLKSVFYHELSLLQLIFGFHEQSFISSCKAQDYSLFAGNQYRNIIENFKTVQNKCIPKLLDSYVSYVDTPISFSPGKHKILLSMTSCKRFDLFQKTVNSFLKCCLDLHLLTEFLVVDDNSSDVDRQLMLKKYPFIHFIFKSESEKGHVKSMNIIRSYLLQNKFDFLFHLEDDWSFFRKDFFFNKCIDILSSNPSYGQCLLNYHYAEVSEQQVRGGFARSIPSSNKEYYDLKFFEHQYIKDPIERSNFHKTLKPGQGSSCYWPHFSFRVGMTKTKVFEDIGVFNPVNHFEMEYANRYFDKGFITCYFDSLYCSHTGRLTSEIGNENIKNAYQLNNISQFGESVNSSNTPVNTPANTTPNTPINSPTNKDSVVKLTIEPLKLKKTFVVNLERRKDRWDSFSKYIDLYKNIKFDRFIASDGSSLSKSFPLQKLFENVDSQHMMRYGLVGCSLSHILIWKEIILSNCSNDDLFLILEDDVELSDNFDIKLAKLISTIPISTLNLDGVIVFPGHSKYPHNNYDEIPINSLRLDLWDLQKNIKNSQGGTFSYLLNRKAALNLVNTIINKSCYRGIDWVLFLSANVNKTYYSNPRIAYSPVAVSSDKSDSDIQFNSGSLKMSDNEIIQSELKIHNIDGFDVDFEYNNFKLVKKDGSKFIFLNDDKKYDFDNYSDKLVFILVNDLTKFIEKLKNLPLSFYWLFPSTYKNNIVILIPDPLMNDKIEKERFLNGKYFDLNYSF